jgi:hypothetical protein
VSGYLYFEHRSCGAIILVTGVILKRDVVSFLKERNTTFIDSEIAGRGSRTAQHTIAVWPFETKE